MNPRKRWFYWEIVSCLTLLNPPCILNALPSFFGDIFNVAISFVYLGGRLEYWRGKLWHLVSDQYIYFYG